MGPVISFVPVLLVIILLLQASTEANPCSDQWMFFGESCYGLFKHPLSWDDAEVDCQTHMEGGHLASILDDQEMRAIASYIRFNQEEDTEVWIGLFTKKAGKRSKWWWVDMSPVQYSPWAPGKPNGERGIEKCAELTAKDYMQWNDRDCEIALPYLCRYSRY